MTRRLLFCTFNLCMTLGIACSSPKVNHAPVVERNSDSTAKNSSLTLSWSPQTVTVFHIYYIDDKLNTREIDSLSNTDANFSKPQISIDKSNMETWPAAGNEACFYVVAEANSVLSDPSDNACVTL